MPVVEIPGVGNVEFPDTMDSKAIAASVQKIHREKQLSGMTLDQRQGTRAKGYKAPAPTMAQAAEDMRESMTPDNPVARAVTAPFRQAVAGPIEGAARIGNAGNRWNSGKPGEKAGAVSDVVRGGMEILSPYAVPVTIANPAAAAGAAVGGTVGAKVGGGIAREFEAPEGVVELAETTGGVVGGGAGAVGGPKVVSGVKRGGTAVKNAAGRVSDIARDPIARDVVGMASPRAGYALDAATKLRERVAAATEAAKSVQSPQASIPAPAGQSQFLPQVPGPQSTFQAQGITPPQAPQLPVVPRATPQATTPAPVEPWNPKLLPPDPFRQTAAWKQGMDALAARRRTTEPVTPTPEGPVTIPFSRETPPPEVFKTAARAERAPKVEALANLLKEHGIAAEEVGRIQPGQWRDMAKALGIDLPKSLGATIRDVQNRVMQIQKAQSVMIEPSAQMKQSLMKPGALDAAKALAEEMEKNQ